MKVSIIVPFYNAEKYLEKCLESLVNQTYKDIEIILINDGSTDKSIKICEKFKKTYSNIIIYNKENGGSASARNIGLIIAKGDYIAFVDSDDFVKSTYIEHMVNLANKYQADLVQCSFKIINNYSEADDNLIGDEKIDIKNNIEMLEYFCSKNSYLSCACLWNKLIKKEILKELRFVEGKGVDDEFLIHRILYKSKRIVITNEILYFYYMSKGSQMRSGYSLKNLDAIEAIESQLKFFEEIKNKRLYNLLLYRYYSSILYNYYMIKKNYKDNKEIINELKVKRNNIFKVIFINEISINDKVLLILKYCCPSLIFKINKLKNIYRCNLGG